MDKENIIKIKIEFGKIFEKNNLTFSETREILQEVLCEVNAAFEKLERTTLIGNRCVPESDIVNP